MMHASKYGRGTSLRPIISSPVYDCKDYEKVPLVDTAATLGDDGSLTVFAINRSMFSQEHMDYIIAAVKALYEDRESIPNMRIVKGRTLPMRHFHAFLEPYYV